MNVNVQAHAAAFVLALLEAGELDLAEEFAAWCLEVGIADLTEHVEAHNA